MLREEILERRARAAKKTQISHRVDMKVRSISISLERCFGNIENVIDTIEMYCNYSTVDNDASFNSLMDSLNLSLLIISRSLASRGRSMTTWRRTVGPTTWSSTSVSPWEPPVSSSWLLAEERRASGESLIFVLSEKIAIP